MKVIGFATKYYTLWEVSKPSTEKVDDYSFRRVQRYDYIQNLSMDLESAKAKLGDSKYEIDLELKGSSSFVSRGELVKNVPENLFRFGKHRYQEIDTIEDLDYIKWYYNESHSEFAKSVLLDKGFIEYDDQLLSKEEYQNLLDEKAKNEYIETLQNGHHFENKKRLELEIKELDSFSFEGAYGTVFVVTYASKCGKLLKYLGTTPQDISEDNFTKVKATTKHDEYNGVEETKLTRIRKI